MKIKCCGKVRTSKFCPDCGTKIEEFCLQSLLEHCRSTERAQRTSIRKLEDYKRESVNPERTAMRIEKHTQVADKWAAWASALEHILVQQATASANGRQ